MTLFFLQGRMDKGEKRHGALKDMNRCIAAIRQELDPIHPIARDRGSWDDTCQYITD